MSLPFRIFLLILFGFGAIWIYRFRDPEIQDWLRPARPPRDLTTDGFQRLRSQPLISPVDGVLEPDGTLRLRILGKERAPKGEVRALAENDTGALALSEEELALVADLPIVEDEEPDSGSEPLAPQPPADISQPPDDGAGGEVPGPPEVVEPHTLPDEPSPDLKGIVAFEEIAYRVEEGDNLWRIAQRFLGSGKRFPEIRDWNRDLFTRVNPEAVPVGVVLKVRVPAAGGAGRLKPGPAPVDKPVERDPAPRKPKQKKPAR